MDSPLTLRLPERFRSRIRLRHLHCFVAVAQTRHLGQAGEALGLTQPAVSKTLTELEELAGTALMVRQRTGTTLTPAGARFLRHAMRVLEDVEAAAGSLAGIAQEHGERLRLGTLPSVVPGLLADAVAAFRAALPHVSVVVQAGMNRALIDWLKADAIDLAIGRMDDPAAMEGLWFESLGPDPLSFAVRPVHPLAGAARLAMREVTAWPMIVPAPGSIPRHNTESLLARHGLAIPGNCLETADANLGRLLTQQSDSVWVAPRSATQRAVALHELVLLPVDTRGTEEPIGLLRRSDRAPGAAAEAFAATVRGLPPG